MGQVFIFITLSKFGALNLAIIGLFRKIVSLCLSFFLYGHTVNAIQSVGLVLAIVSMVANFFEKVSNVYRGKGWLKLELETDSMFYNVSMFNFYKLFRYYFIIIIIIIIFIFYYYYFTFISKSLETN